MDLGPIIQWLKTLPSDLATHYVEEGIVLVVGWATLRVFKRIRTFRAHRFWRPFLNPDTRLVMGGGFPSDEFEPSGLVGYGDAVALGELQQYLSSLVGRRHEFKVVYDKQFAESDLHYPVILIGGPDANKVTRDALPMIRSGLGFDYPHSGGVSILDTATDPTVVYEPHKPSDRGPARDYGIVLRSKNPFTPAQPLLLLAGASGYGTWASARYVASAGFFALRTTRKSDYFECLVETDVVRDAPQDIRLKLIRDLGSAAPIGEQKDRAAPARRGVT